MGAIFSRSTLVNLALLCGVTLASLAALEVLVRLLVFNPNRPYIRTPGWSMNVRTNGLLPHVTEDHVIAINRLGIRGELPLVGAKPSIAILGGSTVEDWVLAEEKTWVRIVQSHLRKECRPSAWVANLGKAGLNARHHLIQLPEVVKYMPDFDMYVVLMGLNDFLFDYHIHHSFQVSEGWWRKSAFMSDAGDEGPLALVAIFRRLYGRYMGSNRNAIPVSDFGNYMEALRVALRKVRPEQQVDTLPSLGEHLLEYRSTILALKEFADKRGKPILFVTQPFLWSANMSKGVWAQLFAGFIGPDINSPDTKWYTPGALEHGLSAYNETLLTMCSEHRLLCVDAAKLLPKEIQYFFDDFHFSDLGAAKVGEIVAEAIRTQSRLCR